jgi:hypothetical protein
MCVFYTWFHVSKQAIGNTEKMEQQASKDSKIADQQ